MSSSRLPAAADAFIHAIRSASTDEFISTLHEQAVLHDGGRDYAGPALRAWADDYFRRGPIALRLINRDWDNGALVLTVLSGTGQGPAVDGPFDWKIQIDGNQIRWLRSERHRLPDLPAPVAALVRAVNSCDVGAMLEVFSEDALVNDELLDHWGKEQLGGWAERNVVGKRLALHVVSSVKHHGQLILTTHATGDFDNRGLPDPLVLSFYFSLHDDKIIQLIILQNQPTP